MKYHLTLPLLLFLASCSTPQIAQPDLTVDNPPAELMKPARKMETIPLPTPKPAVN